jgi:hypothetical protein
MHSTCHILLDQITLIIVGEEYKLSSLLQPPVTSSSWVKISSAPRLQEHSVCILPFE